MCSLKLEANIELHQAGLTAGAKLPQLSIASGCLP